MTRHSPDVAAILAHIRTEVHTRRQELYAETTTTEHSALEQQLQRCIEQLEITRVISAHWPLTGHTLPQRAVTFVNKVVRRYLRWYINPIVEQQNRYNDVVARTLRLQVEAYTELHARLIHSDHSSDDARQNFTDLSGNSPHAAGSMHQAGNSDLLATEMTDLSRLSFQDLQSLVESHGRAEPVSGLTDMQLRPLMAELAAHQNVHAHWPLDGHTPVQRAIALLHKLVRRYLRWLINPIVEQQNAFNAAVTSTLSALLSIDGTVRFQVAARSARQSGGIRKNATD